MRQLGAEIVVSFGEVRIQRDVPAIVRHRADGGKVVKGCVVQGTTGGIGLCQSEIEGDRPSQGDERFLVMFLSTCPVEHLGKELWQILTGSLCWLRLVIQNTFPRT